MKLFSINGKACVVQYRKRYKFMTADEVMRMEFFKDIRREREYEKKQLEEYEKSKQVG